ncbi:MAG: hypothetical protein ABI130_09080 [Leifsonia sp.]
MTDQPLRVRAIVLLWVFALQFLLGMLLNLFVKLPDAHPGRTGDEYFSRSWASLLWALSFGGGVPLFIHALTGAVLVVGTTALFVYALVLRARGWRWPLGLAAFFAFGAFFNGMSYLDYGEDFSSAIMATAWLGAVASISFPLVRKKNRMAARPEEGSQHAV